MKAIIYLLLLIVVLVLIINVINIRSSNKEYYQTVTPSAGYDPILTNQLNIYAVAGNYAPAPALSNAIFDSKGKFLFWNRRRPAFSANRQCIVFDCPAYPKVDKNVTCWTCANNKEFADTFMYYYYRDNVA